MRRLSYLARARLSGRVGSIAFVMRSVQGQWGTVAVVGGGAPIGGFGRSGRARHPGGQVEGGLFAGYDAPRMACLLDGLLYLTAAGRAASQAR